MISAYHSNNSFRKTTVFIYLAFVALVCWPSFATADNSSLWDSLSSEDKYDWMDSYTDLPQGYSKIRFTDFSINDSNQVLLPPDLKMTPQSYEFLQKVHNYFSNELNLSVEDDIHHTVGFLQIREVIILYFGSKMLAVSFKYYQDGCYNEDLNFEDYPSHHFPDEETALKFDCDPSDDVNWSLSASLEVQPGGGEFSLLMPEWGENYLYWTGW